MNIIFIENFDECWVPDYPDENNLSGEMAHGIQLKIPIKFIGIKSRFNKLKISEKPEFNTVTILSGPEPQRSVLEEIIKDKLQSITGPHAIITGLKIENFTKGNIDFFGLLDEKEISAIISDSKYIISRSGYSSIMDYEAMCRKAILIPTPGQTEQIYLAENAIKNRRHLVQYQNSLNLEALIV
jgi:UDP-N-acetylglucosamine transferase subunit ALG13